MSIDPIEEEFFSTEALGSLADALVREAIQNSLDARAGGDASLWLCPGADPRRASRIQRMIVGATAKGTG